MMENGNYLELGYGRAKDIPSSCEDCIKQNRCLETVLSANMKDTLLSKYLTKHIDLECLHKPNSECSITGVRAAGIVADALVSTDLRDLISIIKQTPDRESVSTDNIPQYGDLSISMYLIPIILEEVGPLNYIEFGKKLFFREGKNDEAYRKYAETHCKLAAQLDLARIEKNSSLGYQVSSSIMGKYFCTLSIEQKDLLLPKLCLRIPIIQEALLSKNRKESIEKNLSILSASTIKRRRTGVVDLVEFAAEE